MTKARLWIGVLVALVAVSAGTLRAQDVAATWQGTLQAGGQALRIVIKITNEGGLKAVMYSLDQGGAGLPGTVAVDGSVVKISMPGIGGAYEGRLNADGRSLSGTWSQGGGSLPLTLARATAETAWAVPAGAARPVPMAATATPSFEVATIKPSRPDTPGKLITVRGRMIVTVNTTVSDLATFAYGLHPKQLAGGPSWLESDKFDLNGEPDTPGVPNTNQLRGMLQKLLTDRFKFAFHHDKRELSVYALTVLKSGHKLTKNDTNPNGLPGLFFRGPGVFPVTNATMADFAGTMQAVVLDRPVVDQTGLAGRYDFTLTWTPDETQFGGRGGGLAPPADPSTAPPGLFTAIQEQLGLKFESTKEPVDVLVVDHVEKPTEN